MESGAMEAEVDEDDGTFTNISLTDDAGKSAMKHSLVEQYFALTALQPFNFHEHTKAWLEFHSGQLLSHYITQTSVQISDTDTHNFYTSRHCFSNSYPVILCQTWREEERDLNTVHMGQDSSGVKQMLV